MGDTEVDVGHRRQQTGLNWREPASLSPPMASLSMEGKLENRQRARKKEEERYSAKEKHEARE